MFILETGKTIINTAGYARGMKKEAVLAQIALRLRHHVLRMTTRAGSGHPTTCLSMAELMSCLFFSELRLDPKNPKNPNSDEFVLSKGHASPMLWAAYAEAGIIPVSSLSSYRKFGSLLEGHPTPRMPFVKIATGSLGQGLSAGLGLALAARLQRSKSRVFVMLGDGECAEGSVWEAAALAEKWKLNSVTAILDCNRLGQSGESLHGHNALRWKRKFESFGWAAEVIDGHNIRAILSALKTAKKSARPSIIIARTLKGKGISFLENKEGWHGKTLSEEQLHSALDELGPMPSIDAGKFVQRAKASSSKDVPVSSPKVSPYASGASVATREAYGSMLQKLGENSAVVALDADVKNSTFSEKFRAKYPHRFFDCFIAEQNMVGAACGLAARGFVPFVSTFAAFLTRAHDQVRMAGISGLNIKFCGSHVGVSIGEDGPSQMGLEDIALFRGVPGSVVLYPSDAVSAEACTALAARHRGIAYLRTSRPKTPMVYKSSESFRIGGSKVVAKGSAALIIAAGVTVHESLKAASELKKKGKQVTVLDAYSVQPLDEKTIRKLSMNRKVVVVEDHSAAGGLGEAVAALGIPIVHLCVRKVPMSGSPKELLDWAGIDAKAIVRAVLK